MKLATIAADGRPSAAIVAADGSYIALSGLAEGLPDTVLGLVQAWDVHRSRLQSLALGHGRPADEVTVLAPIPRPPRDVMCVGKNYHEHAREFHGSGFDSSGGAAAAPPAPVIFTKATTSVAGPGDPIPSWKDPTGSVDYEGELAVVIGPGGRNIPAGTAFEHVFGYMVLNDVTSRELQRRHQQWFIGKSIDGFCPMGPWLVTADEVPDVTTLRLTTLVNGELRQDASVADLIFDIPTLIETISRAVTLEPGDIIATGTPAGVGIGFSPPRYLRPGDTVRVEITGLGVLENPVAGAP